VPGADRLTSVFKARLVRRETANLPPPKETPLSAHPLWPELLPYLHAGEEVYYVGRPDLQKQWHDTLGEMAFGGILTLMGGAVVVGFLWAAIANQAPDALMGAIFFALVFAVGLRGLAAPYFKKRLEEKTLYAVTNERVFVLNGCHWGELAAPLPADVAEKSFTIEEVRDYEVENGGRDIAFGGRWIRGRKNRTYWVHQGFLAPDDFDAAITAIRRLLAEHPRDCDAHAAV